MDSLIDVKVEHRPVTSEDTGWARFLGQVKHQLRAPSGGKKLEWLEVGRGFAALGVVLTHYSALPNGKQFTPFSILGAPAVEFFFVLSGFIIFHVHGKEIGHPNAVGQYVWRRWVRIFPIYWIILTAAILLRRFQPTLRDVHLGFFDIAKEFVMAPDRMLLVGQAWTLRHELLFYAVFSVLLINRRLGFTVFIGWMAAVASYLVIAGPPLGQVADPVGILLHHYNLDFALGMGAAMALRHNKLGSVIGGAALAALALAACSLWSGSGVYRILLLKAVFAAIVCGAIVASRRRIAVPAPMLLLGAASYSLYISHEIVGSITMRLAKMLHIDPIPAMLIEACIAVLFAIAFHLAVERQLLNWLRHPRHLLRPGNAVYRHLAAVFGTKTTAVER